MSDTQKLELLLMATNRMTPELRKLLGSLREVRRETGKVIKGLDRLDRQFAKPKASDGMSKLRSEVRGLTRDANRAARELGRMQTRAGKTVKSSGGSSRRISSGDVGLLDDAASAGAGATGLWLSKTGVGAAMSKQEALTDLRNSFYRSSLGAADLNQQMFEGEKIADKLGSKLKGNTADYLNLLSVMRQRGIDTKTILEGAGEAAAYLSIANRTDRITTGENLAQFGQLFGLKGQEYVGAADLLSKIKTAKGLESDELIEGLKYFGGRTATSLNLTGAAGAEQSTRFLAFLRQKTALEGSSIGTASSSFFQMFVKARGKKNDPISELKKLTNVDLNIFDKKGKFLGLENAIQEFNKLKGKLSDEQMMSFGSEIAGEEGAAIFSAMVQKGDEFKTFNTDVNESVGLMKKAEEESGNLSNKVEALTGSLQNLGAAGFAPMLNSLGKFADKANDTVGTLTDFAKANPQIASTASTVLTLGSALLTLKAGSSLASRFLGGANNSFVTTWKSADTLKDKIGGLRKAAASPISVSLQVVAAGMTLDHLIKVFNEVQERNQKLELDNKSLRAQYDSLMGQGKLYNYGKENGQNKEALDSFAEKILETIKQGRALEYSLQPERAGLFEHFWTSQRPYSPWYASKFTDYPGSPAYTFSPDKAANTWKNSDVSAGLQDPNVLARLLLKVERGAGMGLGGEQITALKQALEKTVGKEKLQQAQSIANKETLNLPQGQNFNEQLKQLFQPLSLNPQQNAELSQQAQTLNQSLGLLNQPLPQTTTGLNDLNSAFPPLNANANNASNAVGNFANQANSAAARLSSVQVKPVVFPMLQTPTGTGLPQRARGGTVKRNDPTLVGEAGPEIFIPNRSGSVVSNNGLRELAASGTARGAISKSVTINAPITITGGDSGEVAAMVDRKLRDLEARISRELQPDRVARRVAWAAQRDTERT